MTGLVWNANATCALFEMYKQGWAPLTATSDLIRLII